MGPSCHHVAAEASRFIPSKYQREILEAGNTEGLAPRTIERAKDRIGAKHRRDGFGGRYIWELPGQKPAHGGRPGRGAADEEERGAPLCPQSVQVLAMSPRVGEPGGHGGDGEHGGAPASVEQAGPLSGRSPVGSSRMPLRMDDPGVDSAQALMSSHGEELSTSPCDANDSADPRPSTPPFGCTGCTRRFFSDVGAICFLCRREAGEA